MLLQTYFSDIGTPSTGLTPTVTITDSNTSTVVVDGDTMTEICNGAYKYDFTTYDETKNYYIIFDGGSLLSDADRYTPAILSAADNTYFDNAIDNLDTSITTSISNAIAETESNIRGEDADTLKTISDLQDSIKNKTDNLPNDPADQSLIENAIATAESNIRGGDNDTLKTVSDQMDNSHADIQSMKSRSVQVFGVPKEMLKPPTNDTYTYKFIIGLYDMDGNPEIPDSAPTIKIETSVGSSILIETPMTQVVSQNGQYYYNYELNHLASPTQFVIIFKVIENGITNYYRKTTVVKEQDTTDIEVQESLDDIETIINTIRLSTNNLPSDPADQSLIEAKIADAKNELITIINTTESNIRGVDNDTLKTISDQQDSIKTKTDNIPADVATNANIETEITDAKSDLITTIANTEYNIRGADNDTLKTVSDQLGTATARLTTIDNIADSIKERTDNLPDVPANNTTIINEIVTKNQSIQTVVEAINTYITTQIPNILDDTATKIPNKIDAIGEFDVSEVINGIFNRILTDVTSNSIASGENITFNDAIRALFNRFFREVIQTQTMQSVKNDSGNTIANMAVSDSVTYQKKGSA